MKEEICGTCYAFKVATPSADFPGMPKGAGQCLASPPVPVVGVVQNPITREMQQVVRCMYPIMPSDFPACMLHEKSFKIEKGN